MAISFVQAGDAGPVNAGHSSAVMIGDATIGNCVVVAVYSQATNTSVGVTSPMGVFAQVSPTTPIPGVGGFGSAVTWFACTNVTGVDNTIIVTTNNGGTWYASALEWTGGVDSVNWGDYNTGGGTVATGIVNELTNGQAVCVGCAGPGGTFTADPSSPWSNFNGTAVRVAYLIAATTPEIAQWTFSATTHWICDAVVLSHGAPPAPTLVSPPNASYEDFISGQTFEAIYNAALADSMSAYAMRLKTTGGAYSYYDASLVALSSFPPTWNTQSEAPGATFSVTVPNSLVFDGFTYNWSFACQDATYGGQGPFATDFTVVAQAVPGVIPTAPAGFVTNTTQPVIEWTAVLPAEVEQTSYTVVVESGSFGTVPGSGTTAWASGEVPGQANSAEVGVPLTNGTSYRAFIQITETGGQASLWVYTSFTVNTQIPASPIVTPTPSTDPVTGCPIIALAVQGLDNYLSFADASFEDGTIGTAVGTNCTPTNVTSQALEGTHSLKISPTTSGDASVALGPYACNPGQKVIAFSAFRAQANARTCEVGIQWVGGASTITSTGTADSTSAWTQATPSSTPPSGLTIHGTAPAGTTAFKIILTIKTTTGSGDNHFVDCVAAQPYVASAPVVWGWGGFVGNTSIVITRSDNIYVRWASANNPLPIKAADSQLETVYDYEAVPGQSYTYSAVVQADITAPQTSPPTVSSAAEVPLSTYGWWELNPEAGTATTNPSAVNAQMISWTPVQTEQATANQVIGQATMNIVSNAMMNQDFAGTVETFSDTVYAAFNALLVSAATLFISSPWGQIDSGYFRIGPQSGGMSSGQGTTAKSTTLMPSTAGAGHRTTAITAVSQPRPAV